MAEFVQAGKVLVFVSAKGVHGGAGGEHHPAPRGPRRRHPRGQGPARQ
ncbi:unnamed protein product, partial [Heterosigma akashiwo]